MSIDPAIFRALVEQGATPEMLLAVVEAAAAVDEARKEKKRAGNAERQARHRNKNNALRGVTERDRSPNDIYILTPSEPGLSNDNPPPLADRVVSAWNEGPAKAGATASRPLNAKRKTAMKARAKEHGEDALFEAIRNLSGSKFHCGDNDRGWKANIGWLLTSPENFQKALEMEAPPDAPPVLSFEDRAAAAERSADMFEKMGRTEEAAERRALAENLRKAA